jgi:PAS domain-containing protein
MVRRTCAWCGDGIPEDREGGARGVCLTCAGELLLDGKVTVQSVIDRFPVPVLVVDDDVTVTVLNRRAQEILGVRPEQAAGRRGGDLFGCVNANLPGGCGRSIHCSGCALRLAVTATCRTGEPQSSIPATLKAGDPDHPAAVALTVSTFRRGDAVMVKIDRHGW